MKQDGKPIGGFSRILEVVLVWVRMSVLELTAGT